MPAPPLASYAEEVLCGLCRSHPLGYQPNLVWKNLRVTAGVAYYKQGLIALSLRVLLDEESLRATLTHEYAHLLAYLRHGQKGAGHGEPWRQAMRDLGETPKVRHNYEVERNTPRQQVTYNCLRCGKAIIRARRLPKRRKYIHANCGGDLRLKSIERVTAAACGS